MGGCEFVGVCAWCKREVAHGHVCEVMALAPLWAIAEKIGWIPLCGQVSKRGHLPTREGRQP